MDSKPWYTSKTFAFAAVLVLTGVANMAGYAEWIPDAQTQVVVGQVLAVIGGVVGLLRAYTTRPIAPVA